MDWNTAANTPTDFAVHQRIKQHEQNRRIADIGADIHPEGNTCIPNIPAKLRPLHFAQRGCMAALQIGHRAENPVFFIQIPPHERGFKITERAPLRRDFILKLRMIFALDIIGEKRRDEHRDKAKKQRRIDAQQIDRHKYKIRNIICQYTKAGHGEPLRAANALLCAVELIQPFLILKIARLRLARLAEKVTAQRLRHCNIKMHIEESISDSESPLHNMDRNHPQKRKQKGEPCGIVCCKIRRAVEQVLVQQRLRRADQAEHDPEQCG